MTVGTWLRIHRAWMATFWVAALALWPGASSADWVRVGESDTVFSYVEESTIDVQESTIKVWVLLDFKQPDAKGARSQKFQEVFDCENGASRTAYRIVTTGPMGSGNVLMSLLLTEPATPIPDNSLRDTIFQIIC